MSAGVTSAVGGRAPAGSVAKVVVAMVIMAAIGSLYAWSVLVEPLGRDLGVSRAAISFVFSVALASFTLAMLAGAWLQRRATPARLTLLTGTIGAMGLLLPSATYSLPGLVVGVGVGFGAANGLGYSLALAIVQAAVPARRGLVTGLAVASYTMGSAAFAPILGWSVPEFGIRITLLGWAAGMLAAFGLAAWALSRGGAAFPECAAAPADAELRLTSRAFVSLWLGFLLASLVGVMVIGHAAAIVAALGGDGRSAALAAGLVAIANGVGRLGGGWLTDRLAANRFLPAGMIAAAACLLLVWMWPGHATALTALAVTGVSYGAVAGAYPAIVAQLYGAAEASRVYARVFTSWGLAGLAGPYAGGMLFDRTGAYDTALVAGACAAALAAVACVTIPSSRPTASRRAGPPRRG